MFVPALPALPYRYIIPMALVAAFLRRNLRFIAKDEQIFVEDLTELRAVNGPTVTLLSIMHKSAKIVKAIPLGELEVRAFCFPSSISPPSKFLISPSLYVCVCVCLRTPPLRSIPPRLSPLLLAPPISASLR